ncbi:hypothetical protein [Streptomyces sp. NPDC054784]
MDPSTSALVVAVVGVLGTLVSGVLAHRGALRSKAMELDHAERIRREERVTEERRESVNDRRAAYTSLNHQLRQFHQVLFHHHQALEAGQADPDRTRAREESRHSLRGVYAEAQMVVPDDVLLAGGGLVHQLHRIHVLLAQHEQQAAADESLHDIKERLERASEGLYETRQTMRRSLGISELPIGRPEGYGRF